MDDVIKSPNFLDKRQKNLKTKMKGIEHRTTKEIKSLKLFKKKIKCEMVND